jgi:hypothetical protein
MEEFSHVRKPIGPASNNWTDSELDRADDRFRQYVALALRIFERIELDPEEMARFETLTASRRKFTIKDKGPTTHPPKPKE